MMVLQQSRREFVLAASTIVAGSLISPKTFSAPLVYQKKVNPLCVFTKCLQFLDYAQLAETLASIGFDGADLPVRKGGYILPEKVQTELPKVVRSLKSTGIDVPMIVTSINDPDDPHTDKILGIASQLGIKHYRMGYFKYDPVKSVQENLDQHKRTMERLAKINQKFGIHGEYQNHAGTGVGAPVWDLYWILKDSDPADIGVQYDIRHAVCEGGNSWPIGMNLIAPWIKSFDIKDFLWYKDQGKLKIKNVPLGEGMVDYDMFLKEYSRHRLGGPISIHYEYDLGGAEHGKIQPTMGLEQISVYLKRDLKWLRTKLNEHKIA